MSDDFVILPVRVVQRFLLSCLWAGMLASAAGAEQIDFNRDVRPILSDKCFHCHGPDADNQDSAFRLDSADSAYADLGGYFGITAGEPDQSELVSRIESADPDQIMPPPDAPRHLTDREKAILRQWVAEGARYDQHWAFTPPTRPVVPEGSSAIDYFVRRHLASKELWPSQRASKRQLIRRITLDLTGLPPTPEEVDSFASDNDPRAFEVVVDRLLASPAYGERMAQDWLDASRYADTAGYQGDFRRSQWPWRDWVVAAYNANMPFDRFSIEQLAGDLLPDATDQTRLATAFNRNHRINNEGGIIPAEFLVEYVSDRVETTSTVWLGLTVGCARCHDHKYDPITMTDYYQLFAFFHNVPEKGKDGSIAPVPNMDVFTGGTKHEHQTLSSEVKRLQAEQKNYPRIHQQEFESWVDGQHQQRPSTAFMANAIAHYSFDYPNGKVLTNLQQPKLSARIQGRENYVKTVAEGKFGAAVAFNDAGHVRLGKLFGKSGFDTSQPASWSLWIKPQKNSIGDIVSCQSPDADRRGYLISIVKTDIPGELAVAFRLIGDAAAGQQLEVRSRPVVKQRAKDFTHLAITYDGSLSPEGIEISIDGEPVPLSTEADSLDSNITVQQDHLLGSGLSYAVVDEVSIFAERLSRESIRLLSRLDSKELLLGTSERNKTQSTYLQKRYFEDHDPEYRELDQQLRRQQKQLAAFERSKITKVSIMEEMPEPRPTYRLIRGDYRKPDTRKSLTPATIGSLPAMKEKLPKNRLGLAYWLFQTDNPLTARVAVNRYWQMLFGRGLVRTPEDFGSQGAMPTHPDLLDWLAVEFRESGWNVKALLKLIVMSDTYCQDSRRTTGDAEQDPTNQWLARGPRYRLSAFAIRDQALAASGLLSRQRGGAPVMPYQPDGLWEEVSAKGFKYVVAKDDGLYRRSLYTFWRRTVPPPNMMNFDSAAREACTVNFSRTNTPLQAMNLLNDPQYVEAARGLGERMMREAGESPEARISRCSQLLLARPPSDEELKVLTAGYLDYQAAFDKDNEAARAFISVGNSKPDPALDPAQLAACSAIASIFLNLDETITKE